MAPGSFGENVSNVQQRFMFLVVMSGNYCGNPVLFVASAFQKWIGLGLISSLIFPWVPKSFAFLNEK